MPGTKAEENIAQSTGNETEKWANKLEDEADDIIKDFYHPKDKEGEVKDGDDKGDGDNNSDDNSDTKGTSDDTDGTDAGDDKGDEKSGRDEDKDRKTANADSDSNSDDNIETLRTDRDRFQKQAKDNKAEYTKGQQKLKEAIGRTEEMEDQIFSLRSKIEDLSSSTQTKTEDKEAKKEIRKDIGELSSKIKAINDVDPDLGKVMVPAFEELLGEIKTLKEDIITNNAKAEKSAEQIASDTHFGKLDREVPEWEDTIKSEEFAEYIDDLTPRQKRLALNDIAKGSAEDIIEVIGDYSATLPTKEETTKADKKADKVKKAQGISNPKFDKSKERNTGETYKFTRSEIRSMSEKEFAKNETEIDNAMANGLVDMAN